MPASTKIEFSCLNGNLMVPKILPLTLIFGCNSRKGGPKADNVSSIASAMMDLIRTWSQHHFHALGRKIVGRGREPMRVSGERE